MLFIINYMIVLCSECLHCEWFNSHLALNKKVLPSNDSGSQLAEPKTEEGGGGEGSESGSEEEAWAVAQYAAGGYSPRYLAAGALEPATLVAEAAHDAQRLAYLRARLRHAAAPPPPAAAPAALEDAARRSMAGGGGAQFSVEHALPDQPCLWADKYRPRKPRYFNR